MTAPENGGLLSYGGSQKAIPKQSAICECYMCIVAIHACCKLEGSGNNINQNRRQMSGRDGLEVALFQSQVFTNLERDGDGHVEM